MKLKFGAIVVGGSGKIGGHVVSHNKGGQYLRTKVKPTNPKSSYQVNVRSRFAANSKNWDSLTDAQRSNWNTASALQAVKDRMGTAIQLSGKALYSKVNNNLVNIGSSAITSPVNPGAGFVMVISSIAVVNSTGIITLTFSTAIPSTHKILVFATPTYSKGKSFVANKLRQISVLTSADTSPLLQTTQYAARFGAPGAVGSKISFLFKAVEIASGLTSQAAGFVATIS